MLVFYHTWKRIFSMCFFSNFLHSIIQIFDRYDSCTLSVGWSSPLWDFRLTPYSHTIGPTESAVLRWNSQHGAVFVDGSHLKVNQLFFQSLVHIFISVLLWNGTRYRAVCYCVPAISWHDIFSHWIDYMSWFLITFLAVADCISFHCRDISSFSLLISLIFFRNHQHDLELGDEIKLDGHAPFLKIFDPVIL